MDRSGNRSANGVSFSRLRVLFVEFLLFDFPGVTFARKMHAKTMEQAQVIFRMRCTEVMVSDFSVFYRGRTCEYKVQNNGR